MSRRHIPLALFPGEVACRTPGPEIEKVVRRTASDARFKLLVQDAVVGFVVHAISLTLGRGLCVDRLAHIFLSSCSCNKVRNKGVEISAG